MTNFGAAFCHRECWQEGRKVRNCNLQGVRHVLLAQAVVGSPTLSTEIASRRSSTAHIAPRTRWRPQRQNILTPQGRWECLSVPLPLPWGTFWEGHQSIAGGDTGDKNTSRPVKISARSSSRRLAVQAARTSPYARTTDLRRGERPLTEIPRRRFQTLCDRLRKQDRSRRSGSNK